MLKFWKTIESIIKHPVNNNEEALIAAIKEALLKDGKTLDSVQQTFAPFHKFFLGVQPKVNV